MMDEVYQTERKKNPEKIALKIWDGSKIIRVVCDLRWYLFTADTHGIKCDDTKIGVCAFKMLGCGLLCVKEEKKTP